MQMRLLIFAFLIVPLALSGQTNANLLERLKTAPKSEKIQLYIQLSQSYAESRPDSAVFYANEGIKLAQANGDERGQASILLELGRVNAMHHHTALARKFADEALAMFRTLKDTEGIAKGYDLLGLLDGDDHNVQSAKNDLGEALNYFNHSRDSSGITESYEGLGRVYEEKGDADNALAYYQKALGRYEQHVPKSEAYFVLLENIANLYLKKGNTKAALEYLRKGVQDSRHQGKRDSEVYLIDKEGEVFQKAGDQRTALATYKQALTEAKKNGQPEEEARALINIAGVLKKADATESLNDLHTALKIAKELNQPQLEARIYEALTSVYQQQKDYREAMVTLDEQHRLVDSLLAADTARDIAALDSSYLLERSEEKVGTLQRANRQDRDALKLGTIVLAAVVAIAVLLWVYLRKVKRLNQALAASNRVKDTLFSVIGHDLKGPASSTVQLFELMETETFSEAETKGMIADLKKQTTASLELLQALFEWGKAQLKGVQVNAIKLSPSTIISRCVDLLSPQAAQKSIHISNIVTSHLSIFVDADHFELIIRNLVANAIKFSHPASEVNISAEPSADRREVIFAIRDQGVGISKAQQAAFQLGNIQVNFGTWGEKGSGLGLMLVKDFVRANNGRIWLESEEGHGTTFYVSFVAA